MKRINNASYRSLLKKAAVLSALSLAIIAMAAGTVSAKGKKYGLFVGINNYPAGINSLQGAVNDATDLRALLIAKYKFAAGNTTLLIDSAATRANIIARIKAFGLLAGAGDLFVFQYSGHGSLFLDADSQFKDERTKVEVNLDFGDGDPYILPLDYYDSAIVPWDARARTSGKAWNNMILDDELYDLFSPITKKGAMVVFISDSCHSGTVGKGPKVKGKARFMQPESILRVKSLDDVKGVSPKNQRTRLAQIVPGKYLALAAARDSEVAWDSPGGNVMNGMFSASLIEVLKASKTLITYKRLMELVNPVVVRKSLEVYDTEQNPQLDTRFGTANVKIFEAVFK